MDTPIRQLVGHYLAAHPKIHAFHAATGRAAEAVTGSGAGLDLFAGERVLAVTSWEELPKGYEHRAALAITDLRTCVSGYSSTQGGMNGKRYHVPHAALQSVEWKASLMSNFLKLHGAGAQADLPFGESTEALGPFYEQLARVHPHHRRPPHTPMPEATAGDPAGVHSARHGLWLDDPAATGMLGQIGSHLDRGMPAETARDLVHRVILDHRARAAAPGMLDGRWLSPAAAQDFGQGLCRLLGNPMRQLSPQPGVHQLEFAVTPETGRALNGALTALGVASYVGLGVGFSPGKVLAHAMLTKAPVRELQILFADTGPHTGYRLLAYGAPLEERDSKLANQLHLAIGAMGHRLLAGRVTHGWNAPFDVLIAPPAQNLGAPSSQRATSIS